MERTRSNVIHKFILDRVESHPSDISSMVAREFSISRQAAHRHIHSLVRKGWLTATGRGRSIKYQLAIISEANFEFDLGSPLEEHVVWATYLASAIVNIVKRNVYDILNYGFSEMFNNIIDHSGGTKAKVWLNIYPNKVTVGVSDNGVGIFKKIQDHFHLDDPRHALLELTKGKITSDPERHTGEGVFFASRMFDVFMMWSHYLCYIRHADDDWLLEDRVIDWDGTYIVMSINKYSERATAEVFEKYASDAESFGFTKTHVPVNLALYEGESLISRSQARRLLARVDRFKEVWLDFKDVKSIGPAFADEIFRVFSKAHPAIHLFWENTDPAVEKMIRRARINEM